MKIVIGNYSYTRDEQISAINYMYGISYKEAEEGLNFNKYSENDIKRAILYQETEGLPYEVRRKQFETNLKIYGVK